MVEYKFQQRKRKVTYPPLPPPSLPSLPLSHSYLSIAPAALLATRKPYVNSPVVELDASRKIFRNSLTKTRLSEVSVQETDNENDGEDEFDDDIEPRNSLFKSSSTGGESESTSTSKPLLSRLSKVGTLSKLTIVSPSSLLSSPQSDKTDKEKKKMPRPLMKAATVSSGLGSSKGIRQTLKELHDRSPSNSPESSPNITRKQFEVEKNEQPTAEIKEKPVPSPHPTATASASAAILPAPMDSIAVSRSRSNSDHEIPGPPSEPPPLEDSPLFNRKRLNSGITLLIVLVVISIQ